MSELQRYIQVVHALPGRTRLRVSWLQEDVQAANRIANVALDQPGVLEVKVRSRTGSVLCYHEPGKVNAALLAQSLADACGVKMVLAPGDRTPVPPRDGPPAGRLAQEVTNFFKELNDDILRGSRGAVDLGTLAAFGFFGAGAVEVVAKGSLRAPPWFNLAWWGLSLFTTFEKDDMANGAAAPGTTADSG